VILTLGMSDTTFYFLKEAFKKRDFQVVVAEGCPRYDGHTMARKLSDVGVQTTLITDSAVFAMMARANKVRQCGKSYECVTPICDL
jgi:translation initiation factor eIF-2B subunit beta